MPVTLAQRPLPTCTAPPPPPPCCGWCAGFGYLVDDDFGEVPCPECLGTGVGAWVAPCEFVLDPTHTHPKPGKRRAVYDPIRRRLTLTQGRKTTAYDVREIGGVDPEYGRAFELAKDGGECRELQCGPAGVSCSCLGESYQSNAKANQRAHEKGGTVYPSFGCGHLDAVVPLLEAGWFDIVPPVNG